MACFRLVDTEVLTNVVDLLGTTESLLGEKGVKDNASHMCK